MSAALQVQAGSGDHLSRVTSLLGGPRVLRANPTNPLEVHNLLRTGLPQQALDHLVVSVRFVKGGHHFEDAFGMTFRTYQRRKQPGTEPLSPGQSGRTWTFARVLAKATEVFGTQDAAEAWMTGPVTGLDGQTPLELLQSPAGVDLVDAFLTRLEYGVYT